MSEQTNQTNESQTLLQIASVVPETASAGKQLVIARWKNTDNKPVAAANRARCVEIDSSLWSNDESIKTINAQNKSLALLMLDTIEDLAKSYLSAICEESNMTRTQVPSSQFTISELLNWQAEQAAISGRLNGDTIKQWIGESYTIRTIAEKHGKEIGASLGEQFVKLAGPNHGLTNERANKILTNLWDSRDSESNTGLRIQMRLEAISKKKTDANILDSIL